MNRRTDGPRRWRPAMLVSIAFIASTLAVVAWQGSAEATSQKPFAVVICTAGQTCSPGSPPVVAPGSASGTTKSPASITAVITNENTKGAGLQVGSVNLVAPSGFSIVSASIDGTIAACTATTPKTTSCNSGSVLELRNINIAPGAFVQVSMAIDTPPPPSCTTATPCQWSANGKQANDYAGQGNDLNLDSASSQLGVVTSSEATCTANNQANSCSSTLADGGATASPGGSVSITTSATGTSNGIFYQSIDYGPHLDPAGECSGINSMHDEYISGTALNGSDARSFTVTITTTDYPGYKAELCLTTSKPFRAKSPSADDEPEVVPDSDDWVLQDAVPVTQPDGTPGYAGLLPDCTGGTPPTVDCQNQPGVVSRSTSPDGTVHTIVASFPAGFDATLRN